jgi:hypothetical protein
MGSNKTFQQKHGERVMLGEAAEFRRLRHAIKKAAGDRERAIRNVCRLYGVTASTRCRPASGQPRWHCSVRTSERFPVSWKFPAGRFSISLAVRMRTRPRDSVRVSGEASSAEAGRVVLTSRR